MKPRNFIPWGKIFLILTLSLIPLQTVVGQPLTQDELVAPVEPQVLEQIANQGQATYWVIMKEQADLRGASQIADWKARGQYVYDWLTSLAATTQAGLISDLNKQGVKSKSFWVLNSIQVTSGQAVLDQIRRQTQVKEILANRTFAIPTPSPATLLGRIDAVEWNIARINAPEVWSTFAAHGEGIVVASIDTGVQYDHPALVAQYRGNTGGGNFDHNYNWFDPSGVCGDPSLVPCDNNGHGSHVMGIMVGDDGGANQIGVAPRARFIAAKGCESDYCTAEALAASAQWILAPTDLSGANPRPDLRPHVVNGSFGGTGGNTWYQAFVQAWVAAGIFPAFSNGNAGPYCNTAGSPGDYVESYASAAFDINNVIAGFSSRGPSASGNIKPNIAAPGASIRSSVPGNAYTSLSGSSMASPHTAATVALMWSAAPILVGDITATRALLDRTAIDTSDLECGGTATNNNIWGEGRLDAFAAVSQSPIGPAGALQGTVTDANTGLPVSGATVQAAGPITRAITTDTGGAYSFRALSEGTYDVTATKFGYQSQTATGVAIISGATAVQDLAIAPVPSYSVSGYVFDGSGQPIAGATVTIEGTPIPPATTDATGLYSFAGVPAGTYNVQAWAGRCNDPQTLPLVLTGNLTAFNFALPPRSDAFGYYCQIQTPAYIEAETVIPLMGDDAWTPISLPFPFVFYGKTYNTAFVATNGYINFLAGNSYYFNERIPSTGAPNGAIYPFWDDLYVDGSASVRSQLLDSAPNRRFVIEWRNVHPYTDWTRRLDFEIVLYENGQILTQYRNIENDGRMKGNSATLGIENATGADALQYSYDQAAMDDPEFAVLYRVPPSALEGTVTDSNDGLPVAGATVKALRPGSPERQTTTDANGLYHMQLRLGEYTIQVSKTNYSTESALVNLVAEDATYTQNFALRTPRAAVSPTALTFIVPLGQQRTKALTISNTGNWGMNWTINEIGGNQTATALLSGSRPPKNDRYDPNASTTRGLYPSGLTPTAPGDIIRAWTPTGVAIAWGVGFDGNVWLSDVFNSPRNHQFTVDGAPTGVSWPANFGGAWVADMAYDTGRGWMCQVNVGGDNGIYCWDPNTGSVVGSITGAFPWTSVSQRGLAYRPDDDTFYIGGWNDGTLYHIAGFGHPTPGALISQCEPPSGDISGLAWNPAASIVWEATNSYLDTIYALNPDTCAVLATLNHPSPGYDGAGLEMEASGNLWMIDLDPKTVYLIDSGIPNFSNVPWLSENPTSGSVAAGGQQTIQITANAAGLGPGVYKAELAIQTNSGRMPDLRVPVALIVPAYFTGVNSGGSQYVDVSGETWYADRQYAPGSFGYVDKSESISTRSAIAGTNDDPLYQDARRGQVEYKFDGLIPGVYQVELGFAEIQNQDRNRRVYDVLVEGGYVLPAHDISAEVGKNTADNHTFYMYVNDGSLSIRFVTRRSFKEPLINAIRVIHRPDF
jgi:subtilisin family serine protease